MSDRDRFTSVDREREAEVQAAYERLRRRRVTQGEQEFVSGRDALEDAWAEDARYTGRDEGW